MKPHNLFNTDDRAVSPVIGVILMVAITVILAAVIGTFVLGLGDSLGDSQPSTQLDVSLSSDGAGNGTITIEHVGGDTVPSGDVRVVIDDVDSSNQASGMLDTSISVGDTVDADFGGSSTKVNEARVRLIHEPSESILFERTYDVSDEEIKLSGTDVSITTFAP
ncbi:type IV pilin [Halorubrum aquaticum]|uniref:type IV pilin n=1 Tax=Halorubrum aquaticum TaxID=387340 RepID=UPI00122C8886|nr:type IV pilin N-terminal domain-containing protein [Halorubrum aquaticum]